MKHVRDKIDFLKAREKLGLSQEAVAEIMHLPRPIVTGRQTVSRWEKVGPPGPARAMMEALLSGYRPANWRGK